MPRYSKCPAPVATVSEGLLDSCTDIYPLLAAGLFSLLETKSNRSNDLDRKKLMTNVASYRLVCREMRSCVDSLIKIKFQSIIDDARLLWQKGKELNDLGSSPSFNANTNHDGNEVAKCSQEVRELADAYSRCEAYFPPLYVQASCKELRKGKTGGLHILRLHMTVSNFMAIARERCYAQSCSGTKNAPNIADIEVYKNLTSVSFYDKSGIYRSLTLYCKSDSFSNMCVARKDMKNAFSAAKSKKLAIEMFRRRDMYDYDQMFDYFDERAKIDCISRRDHNWIIIILPVLVLNFHDLEVPSIQNWLDISDVELECCKKEMAFKELQKEEKVRKMREVNAVILERDVDRAIARLNCGFNDVEAAKLVFPGAVSLLRTSLLHTDHKATSHAFDIRQVSTCFKEIKTLMVRMREFDCKCYGSKIASEHAYNFMSGKAMGVMSSEFKNVYSCIREGPFVFMSESYRDSYYTVDAVCASMHTFDIIQEWKLHENKDSDKFLDLLIPFDTASSRKCWRCVSQIRIQRIDHVFVKSVHAVAEASHLDIKISAPPPFHIQKKYNTWFSDTFTLLVTEPQTRSIALWMLQIYPRNLCRMIVHDERVRCYLKSRGVKVLWV